MTVRELLHSIEAIAYSLKVMAYSIVNYIKDVVALMTGQKSFIDTEISVVFGFVIFAMVFVWFVYSLINFAYQAIFNTKKSDLD